MVFKQRHRWMLISLVGMLGFVLVLQALDGGVSDPTATPHLGTGAVIFDSGLLVFREGLESILVLAAIVASMVGANHSLRRPISIGAGIGLVVTALTWLVAVALIGQMGGAGLQIQAITGLIALLVLLVVMNWFFHKVYWTGWISHQNRKKRRLHGSPAAPGAERKVFVGLVVLGVASVYREGFEIVLFLQNLRLQYGQATVLDRCRDRRRARRNRRCDHLSESWPLPYRRMLIVTGVMLGAVLRGDGRGAGPRDAAGRLDRDHVPWVRASCWMGTWFAIFPTAQGLVAQAGAIGLVLGSYFWAEETRVRRPRRRGQRPAERLEHAPAEAAEAAVGVVARERLADAS